MPFDPLLVIPDAAALLACGVAATIDVRSYRVPNRLTLAAAAAGLAVNLALGAAAGAPGAWLLASLGGAAVGLVAFGLLGALGAVGMGDVKLVAAVGALVRWPLVLPMLLYTALAGGVLALAIALRRRRLGQVARNLGRLGEVRAAAALHRMPYALAIALGCAWAVASRYWPALRLL